VDAAVALGQIIDPQQRCLRGVLPERRRIIRLPGLQQARTGLPRPVGYEKTAETR